jgi:hypothetical protein
MRLWEKAKTDYPALSKMDIVQETCPDIIHIACKPHVCFKELSAQQQREVPEAEGIPLMCIRCWERELN